MLKIPPELLQKYDRLMINSHIHPEEYPSLRKWLRFYLDFSKKYGHGYADYEAMLRYCTRHPG